MGGIVEFWQRGAREKQPRWRRVDGFNGPSVASHPFLRWPGQASQR